MTVVAPIALSLLSLLQTGTPSLLDRVKVLDDKAAAPIVAADTAATSRALDELIARVDASVHSDRQRPEQRRVQYDEEGLALGVRVATLLSKATGDSTYARRFRAREQRLAGTKLLNDRQYRKAVASLRAALREAQAVGDRWLETITRVNLAYGHLELGERTQALAECEKAVEVSNTLDDKARALTIFNLGSVYLHLGNFARAIDYSQQATALSEKLGMRLWQGNSLLNTGAAYQQLGQLDMAQGVLIKALAVLEKTSDRLGLGRALYNLGLIASSQERYRDAATYMERALPIIRAVDIRHSHAIETDKKAYQNPFEVSALQVLVDSYSMTGETEKASARQAELRAVKERSLQASEHKHPSK